MLVVFNWNRSGQMLPDIIVTLILVVIVGSAIYYIYKEKKKGRRCIGCPMAGDCARASACNSMNKTTK
ncbi:MAG: FeoB-associated Cys-rich membrane protein [Lachnospiraceae bacterium]|nr:FeoB-associated Cys-rich membrane protein [Lachnospiraceae bacterium]